MDEFKITLSNPSIMKDTTLAEICVDADVLVGFSSANAFTEDMIKSLALHPLVFAMANPSPEISPELAKSVRDDVIIATGSSDYPNHINNVMCFPFLFRAALDTRSTQINEEMMIACALALANLTREPVPQEVENAYPDRKFVFGKEYIIPTPLDPRLITILPAAVAKAAMESGVART
jgi:malate dehydrogenase (oxaloacetate-decarboxylating)(NADP+)